MVDLKQSVQYVKSVGPNKANLLNNLNIYTLEDLMAETNDFNELVYAINGTPFYPIGILVNEITPLIADASNILELPIFYRDTPNPKERIVKKYTPKRIRSHYDNLNR